MSESVTLKSYFYEVLIPSSQKNTSSPIEDILHHVSISFMKKLALYKCFNPRTHTGCDYRNAIENGASEVSIHAPTRGATIGITDRVSSEERVSIHAPTRGATSNPGEVQPRPQGFNPRTHTGCDDTEVALYTAHLDVSIHAPTRGATKRGVSYLNQEKFQSTHPHGVRHTTTLVVACLTMFQSTHPHGVRHRRSKGMIRPSGFQSTHPHGVRHSIQRHW